LINERDRSEPRVHDLDERYRALDGTVFCSGVQALVRLPLDQLRVDRRSGLRTAGFISGYQGSPLAGYDKEVHHARRHLEALGVVHQPGLNEELAAAAVMGSQLASTVADHRYDGVVGLWYGKAPGLDRAGDAIRHGNFAGASPHGGVVLLVGDDPGAKSSTLPSASEHSLYDLMIPTLAPGSVQELLDLGRHAIGLSRASGLWSALKVIAAVADGTATVDVDLDRVVPVFEPGPTFVPEVSGNLMTPFTLEREREMLEVRLEVARRYGTVNRLNEAVVNPADAWLGIVAPSHTYPRVREALGLLGLDDQDLYSLGIRVLRVGLLYPLDRQQLRSFAQGLQTVLVVEEKRPFVALHLRDALYGMADAPEVIGQRDGRDRPLIPGANSLNADQLVEPLRRILTPRVGPERLRSSQPEADHRVRISIPLTARTPFFCSGCPHNTSTVVSPGVLMGAGIGCSCMVVYMEEDVGHVSSLTCMGSEGAQWVGMSPFVGTDHFVQNMGDGTFAHSGQLAIQAAVAADVNITYKLLFNGVVAMTGGQGAVGALGVPAIADGLLAQGVKKVVITTDDVKRYRGADLPDGVEVRDRSRLLETQQELAKLSGVTVLIHDQRCAAELRRDRKRGKVAAPTERIVINQRVCEGCGDCGAKSNCLSVQPIDTEFGRKTHIHQGSCNFDRSCINGDCPSFATVTTVGGGAPVKRSAVELTSDEIPAAPIAEASTTIRMPGIGGTGVVTVSQVLGMAATIAGLSVTGLDQTGLSQKAGPVVSDLHLSGSPTQGDSKIAKGQVDVCLAFDLLVAAQPAQLDGLASGRTVVVGSSSATPTGQSIRHPDRPGPTVESLRSLLDDHSRAETNVYLDAGDLSERLFDDAAMANVLLLGVAHQLGLLPVSTSALERAIELNGVAVERNLQAFRWGRLWVADRPRFERLVPRAPGLEEPSEWAQAALRDVPLSAELRRRVARRVDDLVAYQNRRYARRFVTSVNRVAAAEHAIAPDSEALTEAVAFNLHHLMAYKDEYEVARLLLSDQARQELEAVGGQRIKVVWHLHPPLLRAAGMKKKLRLGPWFRPVLATLTRLKWLRGRALDPFAHNEVRRTERTLIPEYLHTIDRLLSALSRDCLEQAVEVAALADQIRGYEHVKLRNVTQYRQANAEALAHFPAR